MAYPYPPYGVLPPNYYPQPMPDQLTQLRQNQMPMQPMLPQAMVQPATVPPATPAQPSVQNGIIWVQGESGAKAYMVAPGNTVPLWDSENQTIYLKTVDASGMPSMRILDYTERTAMQAPAQQPAPQLDPSIYVTWDRLDDYIAERLKKPAKTVRTKEDTNHGEPVVQGT